MPQSHALETRTFVAGSAITPGLSVAALSATPYVWNAAFCAMFWYSALIQSVEGTPVRIRNSSIQPFHLASEKAALLPKTSGLSLSATAVNVPLTVFSSPSRNARNVALLKTTVA